MNCDKKRVTGTKSRRNSDRGGRDKMKRGGGQREERVR